MKKKNWRVGDLISVDSIPCRVRFVNCGLAYISPVKDSPTDTRIARHIAYAKVDEIGKLTRL